MDELLSPTPPWILLDRIGEDEERILPQLYSRGDSAHVVRVLRGKRMRTRQALMNEFAAAWQFFEGFGENWHALEDCLIYLDDYLPAGSYFNVITCPQELLADDDPQELGWLLQTLESVGEWWSKPINDNPPYDRPAVPFHTVLRLRDQDWEALDPRLKRYPFWAALASPRYHPGL